MSDKVIWITGASTGIGKSLAIKFSKQGWKVAISARRKGLLDEISKEYENIHAFPLDVTNQKACLDVFQNIKSKLKFVDIAVFCTGMHDPKSEKNFNLEKVREIMEVNYFGTVNCINSVYEYFKNKKSGQISIVSSVAGYRGLPAAGAYCASKSALITLAESLYFDLIRSNVRVSIISPGFIKTPMTDKNDFPMPMLKTPEFAADQIFNGLTKGKSFEIHFPKTFTFMMKIIQIIPNWLYFGTINFGNKYFLKKKE